MPALSCIPCVSLQSIDAAHGQLDAFSSIGDSFDSIQTSISGQLETKIDDIRPTAETADAWWVAGWRAEQGTSRVHIAQRLSSASAFLHSLPA